VRARVLLMLLALAGCGAGDPTAIVVELTSDLAPAQVQELHLRVRDARGQQLQDLTLSSDALPGRLSLVPGDPGAKTVVTVEGSALLVGGVTLTRTASVPFRRGATLLLRLALEASCACVSCPPDFTCDEGARCAAIARGADTLPVYTPRGQLDHTPGTALVPACDGDGGPGRPDGGPDVSAPLDGGADRTGPDRGGAEPDAPPAGTDSLAADGPNAPPDAATADAPVVPPPVDAPLSPPDAPLDLAALPPDAATPDGAVVRPQGAACTANDQCGTHACVDGVCCESACIAPCSSCNHLQTGAPDGTCAAVFSGTDPGGDCAADMPMSCGYDGTCQAGACRLYGTATLCAAATCAASTFTPARTCTGAGGCTPPAPQDCGLYLCTPTGCRLTCSAHADCAPTAYCDTTTCVAQKAALAPCTVPRECRSGSCSLGLCL
jgi:hypothetical protein